MQFKWSVVPGAVDHRAMARASLRAARYKVTHTWVGLLLVPVGAYLGQVAYGTYRSAGWGGLGVLAGWAVAVGAIVTVLARRQQAKAFSVSEDVSKAYEVTADEETICKSGPNWTHEFPWSEVSLLDRRGGQMFLVRAGVEILGLPDAALQPSPHGGPDVSEAKLRKWQKLHRRDSDLSGDSWSGTMPLVRTGTVPIAVWDGTVSGVDPEDAIGTYLADAAVFRQRPKVIALTVLWAVVMYFITGSLLLPMVGLVVVLGLMATLRRRQARLYRQTLMKDGKFPSVALDTEGVSVHYPKGNYFFPWHLFDGVDRVPGELILRGAANVPVVCPDAHLQPSRFGGPHEVFVAAQTLIAGGTLSAPRPSDEPAQPGTFDPPWGQPPQS